jgi:hypothetical protein
LTEDDGPPGEEQMQTVPEQLEFLSQQVKEIADYVRAMKQADGSLPQPIEDRV